MLTSDTAFLFPELGQAEIDDLLYTVSGISVSDIAPVTDNTQGLAELVGIEPGDGSESSPPTEFGAAVARDLGDVAEELLRYPSVAGHAAAIAAGHNQGLANGEAEMSARVLVSAMTILQNADRLPDSPGSFARLCRRTGFRDALLQAFPRLGESLHTFCTQRRRHLLTLIARTDEALQDGRLTSLAGQQRDIVQILTGLGDGHRGGQSVSRLVFADGRSVIYKPRDLRVDRGLGELCDRFNEAAGTRIGRLRMVLGDDWGWQELADEKRLPPGVDYFDGCGELLALLPLVGASDMHHENLRHHAGLPVVIDAETLFSVNQMKTPPTPIKLALVSSVINSGLLPSRMDTEYDDHLSVDVGFLGYVEDQSPMAPTMTLERFSSGGVSLQMQAPEVSGEVATRKVIISVDELNALCAGYRRTMEWVMAHRERVSCWLKECFSGVFTRTLIDNTRTYGRLLDLGAHPLVQQSSDVAHLFYHRTGIGKLSRFPAAVIRAEVEDLMHGDIPYFTLNTEDTAVFGSTGDRLAGVLARTPLSNAQYLLEKFSRNDLLLNERLIRASFIDNLDVEEKAPEYQRMRAAARSGDAEPGKLIRAIADELARFALRGDGGAPGWLGAAIQDAAKKHPWRVQELGDDMYAGASGIALFLAAAGVHLGDPELCELAGSYFVARCDALRENAHVRSRQASGGMAGGFPGVAWSAVAGGIITGNLDWIRSGLGLWSCVADEIEAFVECDFMMGIFGIVAAAHQLDRVPEVHALDQDGILARVIDRGLPQALFRDPYLGDEFPGTRYSGMAHGTSGRITALAACRDRHPDIPAALGEMIARHDRWFGAPDRLFLMDAETERSRGKGWCHGAPGILLAAGIRETVGAPLPAGTRQRLLDECLNSGFGLNFTLCHGDLGNLMLLAEAVPARRDWVRRRLADALPGIAHGLASRDSKTFLNDGLMIGLSGIGYGLLCLTSGLTLWSPLTFGPYRVGV